MEARDFDEWRERYDSMTFEEHAAFYRRLHADHPNQSFYDADGVKRLIGMIDSHSIKVVELGGYDGGLAKACLEACPQISTWGNYDICLATEQKPTDPRYHAHTLRDPFLNRGIPDPTLFVASHVLEHLNERDVIFTMDMVEGTPYLFIDAPLDDRGPDGWKGATAAHKLEWTWEQLERLIDDSGYDRIPLDSIGRAYRFRP